MEQQLHGLERSCRRKKIWEAHEKTTRSLKFMFVKGLFHGPLGDVNSGPPLKDTTYLLLLLLLKST